MSRVKIDFPQTAPLFTAQMPVRITDVNYGGHLANDAVLAIAHEARMQFLARAGFTELDAGGVGLIMADAEIAFRAEAFFGDMLAVDVHASDVQTRSFSLLFRIRRSDTDVAWVRTGMVGFDYAERRVTALPQPLLRLLKVE